MNRLTRFTAALLFAVLCGQALANNLTITNVVLKRRDSSTAKVQFDIAWENSWRHGSKADSLFLHDAAWVFFKVRADNSTAWQHVVLDGSGINPVGYSVGTGTPVELVVPDDRVGLFIRRAQDGSGDTAVQQVIAVWNFVESGFAKGDKVKIQALGIEMCYVAEGAFKVGDGLRDAGQLFEGGTGDDPQPFTITNAGSIDCSNEVGCLWGASTSGNNTMGGNGTIPAAFPNGYSAFYCMKYLVTQGQYADFLNLLTRQQQAARCSATTVGNYMSDANAGLKDRNTVHLVEDADPQPRVYATITPDRGCNWLSWADSAALLAWSGLRPMTELEFEKACRGPLEPVKGEYAWGTTSIKQQTGHSDDDGSGTETATPSDANCLYNNGSIQGPTRVGIFAVSGANRQQAGASYWGMMELSGNLWERPVTIGNATGRSFTGAHGDGTLLASGEASVASWPNSKGAGLRGGAFNANVAADMRASDRRSAACEFPLRYNSIVGRGVRSAPSVVVGP